MKQSDIPRIQNQIAIAIELSLANPSFAISGSIALMMLGQIRPRLCKDVDMVRQCTPDELTKVQGSAEVIFCESGEGVFEYSASISKMSMLPVKGIHCAYYAPIRHDLFLMTEGYESEEFMGNRNIRIHRPDVIWEAKQIIGGPKHNAEVFERFKADWKPGPVPLGLLPSWMFAV